MVDAFRRRGIFTFYPIALAVGALLFLTPTADFPCATPDTGKLCLAHAGHDVCFEVNEYRQISFPHKMGDLLRAAHGAR